MSTQVFFHFAPHQKPCNTKMLNILQLEGLFLYKISTGICDTQNYKHKKRKDLLFGILHSILKQLKVTFK